MMGLISTGAIALSSLLSTPAFAQITPDETLGNERSSLRSTTVNNQATDLIEGGARHAANLFHSFSEFNINNGQRVFFANPAGVDRILSRVTGNTRSNILGTLGVLGNADLFLLNPNGIVFGPNARLDVRGSFLSTTADSVVFDNGFAFAASNPQAPPLLTVNVPIGLQFGANPGAILHRSLPTYQVPNGRSLAFVGGQVTLEGSFIRARQGRIELGGVSGNQRVGLSSDRGVYQLDYQGVQGFEDVTLAAGATATVSGEGAGSIQVQGRRIALIEGAALLATTLGAAAGEGVTLFATEAIDLSGTLADGDAGGIFARTSGSGAAPSVTVTTPRLTIQEGAKISTATLAEGNAGNLTINASDRVELIGTTGNGILPSALFADTEGAGTGGILTINTQHLILRQGGNIGVSTVGEGQGGQLIVNASESVKLLGTTADGRDSSSLNAFTWGVSDAGAINITTGRLIIQDGGDIFSAAFADGRGADVVVNASESVEISGIGGIVQGEVVRSRLTTQSTNQFTEAATGNAGNLTITTRQLRVLDGGIINSTTFNRGDAGNLNISVSELLEVNGTALGGDSASTIAANTEGAGRAGDLSIQAERLIVRGGGQIAASTFASGNAGNLAIRATESINVIGIHPNDVSASGIFAQTNSGSTGNAGILRIETDQLTIRGGAEVSASTRGLGAGGQLVVDARERVAVIGTSNNINNLRFSRLSADTFQSGSAGRLNIRTGALLIRDRAQVTTRSFRSGMAGNLRVRADQVRVSDRGRLTAQTEGTGTAGNLRIRTGELLIRDRGNVSVESSGTGNAGELQVNANQLTIQNRGRLTAQTVNSTGGQIDLTISEAIRLNRNGRIVATTRDGVGGDITVNQDSTPVEIIELTENSRLSTRSFDEGTAGDIDLNARQIIVQDEGSILASTIAGLGGDITLQGLEELQIDRGRIAASTQTGRAGNLTISATGGTVRLHDESELSVAAVQAGQAGGLTMRTDNLTVDEGSRISVSSPQGIAGNVRINADSIHLDQGSLTAETGESDETGRFVGAEIELQTSELISLRNNSLISARALANANGGNVEIAAPDGFIVAFPDENSDILASAERGNGGQISLTAQGVFGLEENPSSIRLPMSEINASSETGIAGTIAIDTPDVDLQETVNLPSTFSVPPLAQGCFATSRQSRFVNAGRGGVPSNPADALVGDTLWQELDEREIRDEESTTSTQPLPGNGEKVEAQEEFVEAQGWMMREDGAIELVAPPNSTLYETRTARSIGDACS